jgi:signal peptidase I
MNAVDLAGPVRTSPSTPALGTKLLLRSLWFGLVPALLAVVVTRGLLPDGGSVAGSGALTRFLVESPLIVAVLLFLAFAGLARYWRAYLPGHAALAEDAAPTRGLRGVVGFALTIAVAAGAATLLRHTVIESYQVMSSSMLPGLLPYDRVVASKLAYGSTQLPARGDVVVFEQPEPMPGPKSVVKRVVGLPGDLITMNNGHAVINGWEVPTCDAGVYVHPGTEGGTVGRLLVEFLGDATYLTVHASPFYNFGSAYEVKAGEVFVLGDNRNQSIDSRAWGFGRGAGVPRAKISGRFARVVGSDRNGALDWSRIGRALGLDVPMPGIDATALHEGIARCLKSRPAQTQPPARS